MNNKIELLKLLKFHSQEVDRIDKQLSQICESEIKSFIAAGEIHKAKEMVINFYKDVSDISIYRDTLIATLNHKLISKNIS